MQLFQLFRMPLAPRDDRWVDSLDLCNSEAEYNNDVWEDDAAYGCFHASSGRM